MYEMASESIKAPAAAVTSSFNDRPTLPTSDNPKSWSKGKKWTFTVVASLMTFSATFASSVFSTAEKQTAAEFHVSHEVTILGLSLFMLVSHLTPQMRKIIHPEYRTITPNELI